jgi:hypothetical protein
METTMKMIMTVLAAVALLAGGTAVANAQMGMEEVADEVVPATGYEMAKFARERRRKLPAYIEHDASKLPFGSSEWWRQIEREQGGRRR